MDEAKTLPTLASSRKILSKRDKGLTAKPSLYKSTIRPYNMSQLQVLIFPIWSTS